LQRLRLGTGGGLAWAYAYNGPADRNRSDRRRDDPDRCWQPGRLAVGPSRQRLTPWPRA